MSDMRIIVDSTEAKTKFGQYLDEANIQPVIIRKSKREVAALISIREFERLQSLEDELWKLKADMAAQDGFVGEEPSMNLLKEILDR